MSRDCWWVSVLLVWAVAWAPLISSSDDLSNAIVDVFANSGEYKRVCYITSWSGYRKSPADFSPDYIDPFLCTHVVYAFAGISAEDQIMSMNLKADLADNGGRGYYTKVMELKKQNPNLRVLLSVGGGLLPNIIFSHMVNNDSKRQVFVTSVPQYLTQYGFDGLDVYWKYPVKATGEDVEKDTFTDLIKELHGAFEAEAFVMGKERKILSVSVSATKSIIEQAYDVKNVSLNVDMINIMVSENYGSWEINSDQEKDDVARFARMDREKVLNMTSAVNYWLTLGATADKVLIGIPSYGQIFELGNIAVTRPPGGIIRNTKLSPFIRSGMIPYYEICQKLKNQPYAIFKDPIYGPLYTFDGKHWIGFDDVDTIREKTTYVKAVGLAGVVIWTLDMDDFKGFCGKQTFPLTRVIRDVLEPIKPNVTVQDLKTHYNSLKTNIIPQWRTGRQIDVIPEESRNPIGNFKCTSSGLFPNPFDCTKYFDCDEIGPSLFNVTAFQCAINSAFNGEVCDFIKNVKSCINNNATLSPLSIGRFPCSNSDESFPDEEDCSKYYTCKEIKPGIFENVEEVCSAGFGYDSVLGACNFKDNIPTCKPDANSDNSSSNSRKHCTLDNEKLPHPSDCTKYFTCQKNAENKFDKVQKQCSAGNGFDAELEECNLLESITTCPVNLNIAKCEEGLKFAHPSDCTKYLICEKNAQNQFEKVEKQCDLDHGFDPDIGECNLIESIPSCHKPSDASCKSDDEKLPHPKHCAKYFLCEKGTDGKLKTLEKECDSGQAFDREIQECNLRESVSSCPEYKNRTCKKTDEKLPHPSDCTKYFLCEKNSQNQFNKVEKQCSPGQGFDAEIEECNLIESITSCHKPKNVSQCKKEGEKLPHPKHCAKYFLCEKGPGGKFKKVEKECDFGQAFDPEILECNLRESVSTCPENQNHTCQKSEDKLPHPTDCTKYFICEKNSQNQFDKVEKHCEPGHGFDADIEECNLLESISSCHMPSNLSKCNFQDEKLPNPKHCAKYFLCQKGIDGKFKKLEKHCELGLAFDPKIHECNYRDSVNTCPENQNHTCKKPDEKLPHPTNCTIYFICEKNSQNQFDHVEKHCEAGQGFDPELEECNLMESIYACHVPSNVTHCLKGHKSPHQKNCSMYFECVETLSGEILKVEKSCEIDHAFDPETQECNFKESVHTCPEYKNYTCKKSEEKLPHPSDCTKYFICEINQQNQYLKMEKQCPTGHGFDVVIEECNLIESIAACHKTKKQSTSQPVTTTLPPISTSPHHHRNRSTAKPQVTSTSSVPITNMTKCNDDEEKLPHLTDCTKYFECKINSQNNLEMLEHTCPPDHGYDHELQVCNFKTSVPSCLEYKPTININSNESTCKTEDERLPDPEDCTRYYLCEKTPEGIIDMVPETCEPGHAFHSIFQICDLFQNVPDCHKPYNPPHDNIITTIPPETFTIKKNLSIINPTTLGKPYSHKTYQKTTVSPISKKYHHKTTEQTTIQPTTKIRKIYNKLITTVEPKTRQEPKSEPTTEQMLETTSMKTYHRTRKPITAELETTYIPTRKTYNKTPKPNPQPSDVQKQETYTDKYYYTTYLPPEVGDNKQRTNGEMDMKQTDEDYWEEYKPVTLKPNDDFIHPTESEYDYTNYKFSTKTLWKEITNPNMEESLSGSKTDSVLYEDANLKTSSQPVWDEVTNPSIQESLPSSKTYSILYEDTNLKSSTPQVWKERTKSSTQGSSLFSKPEWKEKTETSTKDSSLSESDHLSDKDTYSKLFTKPGWTNLPKFTTQKASILKTDSIEEHEDGLSCHESGFYRNPYNCSKFYRCIEYLPDFYVAAHFNCPPGLIFDESTNVCNYPFESGRPCQNRVKPAKSKDYTETNNKDGVNVFRIPNKVIKCKKAGFFRDIDNCKKFHRCIEYLSGHFTIYRFSCPSGLVFDEKMERCNWRYASPCNDSLLSESINSKLENSLTEEVQIIDDSYSVSNAGETADDESFDKQTGLKGELNQRGSHVCTKMGYFQNPQNCRHFFKCTEYLPDYFTRYDYKCPEGKAFDLKSNECSSSQEVIQCFDHNLQINRNNIKCSKPGYIKDPDDCTTFYKCVEMENNQMKIFRLSCSNGLVFNSKINLCTRPELAPQCEIITTKATSNRPPITTTSINTDFGKYEDTSIQNKDGVPVSYTCKTQGNFRNPNNCNTYYHCKKSENSNQISAFEIQCPQGKSFDERYEQCKPSLEVTGCDRDSKDQPEANASNNENSDDFICPDDGYFQDPHNCKFFYRCVKFPEERTIHGFHFECPKDLAFDENRQVCTQPAKVSGCFKSSMPKSDKSNGETKEISESIHNANYKEATTIASTTYVSVTTIPVTSKQRLYTNQQYECDKEGFFRDPINCSKFHKCIKSTKEDGFQVYSYTCPFGFVFDSSNKACVAAIMAPPC